MLLLEDVTVSAGEGRVLEALDLVVRRGETYGAVAADPTVRRAVIELLLGRSVPAHGRVRVDGLDPVVDAELLAGRVGVADLHLEDTVLDPAVDVVLVEAAADRPPQLERLVHHSGTRGQRSRATVLVLTDDRALAEWHCDRVGHLP